MTEHADEILIERDVKIPMRDGTLLDAMIWRPAAPGRYPVLVERVGYELGWRSTESGEYYARHGYVVVAQNVRGMFASEGRFVPWVDDGWGQNQDGYDTIEWAAAQPWSNGHVGMIDGSYSGMTQLLVAPTRPPHLRALFVREGSGNVYRDVYFPGGAHWFAFWRDWTIRSFLLRQLGRRPGILSEESTQARVAQAMEEQEGSLWRLPLTSWPPVEGLADWYWEILDHPDDGPYWRATNAERMLPEVDTPIFFITCWFDCFVNGNLRAFAGLRAHGRTPECRAAQRLVVGPWIHGPANVGLRQVGALDFGPEALFDTNELRLPWYDHWLKGAQNGVMDGPPVRLFLMGTNRWISLSDWPPEAVTYRPLYLTGSADRAAGFLTFDDPSRDDSPDRFDYDPVNPVPSQVSLLEIGPTDYRPIEDRVLVYTSEPLEADLHVVGPVRAILHAASSAPDTDWVVRLCDVWPDGRSLSVCDGILRARYRDSFEHPTLMQPGHVYRFEVDLKATAQTFQAGHRLRVHVTSSDFPRYDRNLNTGGPFSKEASGQVATNTVFHDALRPSHLVLPLMTAQTVETALR